MNTTLWIEKKYKILLALIVGGSICISLFYSFHFRIEPIVDARAYDSIAWDIAQGKGYDTDSAIGRPGPGYEYFLAGVYFLFGHHYEAAWIIQAILLGITAYFVAGISKHIFKNHWHPAIGLGSALLIGFSPDLVTVGGMLMTETFFVFLLVISVLAFLKALDGHRHWFIYIALAAITLGGAILTRSNVLFLIVPMLGYLGIKKQWKLFIVFGALLLLTMTPWTLRNYLVQGVAMPFNASLGLLYVGNHEGATGELDINYPRPEGYGDFSKMGQIEADKALKDAGIKYITHHPVEFIRLSLIRLSIYFSIARPFAFWPHLQGLSRFITIILSSIYALIVLGIGIIGAVLALMRLKEREERERIMLFIVMAIMMPLSIAAIIVETRYRFGIYPFLAPFAAYTLWNIVKHRKETMVYWRTLGMTAVIFIANTGFDVMRNLTRIVERL